MIELLNTDCMEYMKGLDDNAFDLAIVDPPYGIGFDNKIRDKVNLKSWDDCAPNDEYFKELTRVSKNQIVWGGNYFPQLWANGCKGFIFWDKDPSVLNYSDGELAWSSFDKPAKRFYWAWNGLADGVRGKNKKHTTIHPTQKPIELYEWLLSNYAKEGDRILDTHTGSASSAIAAHYGGYDFVGCELDEDYYKAACKRFDSETAQIDIFQ